MDYSRGTRKTPWNADCKVKYVPQSWIEEIGDYLRSKNCKIHVIELETQCKVRERYIMDEIRQMYPFDGNKQQRLNRIRCERSLLLWKDAVEAYLTRGQPSASKPNDTIEWDKMMRKGIRRETIGKSRPKTRRNSFPIRTKVKSSWDISCGLLYKKTASHHWVLCCPNDPDILRIKRLKYVREQPMDPPANLTAPTAFICLYGAIFLMGWGK